MIFKDIFKNTQEIEFFKELYFSAFPQEERVPFDFLANKAQLGNSNLYTLYDNDLFVGILVLVYHSDMVFLWYLAVDKNLQGKGYGTKILNLVEQKYKGFRLVLNIDEVDKKFDDFAQRQKRRDFYLKNGYADCFVKTREKGVVYELMSKNGKVSYDDYKQMMIAYLGEELYNKVYELVI